MVLRMIDSKNQHLLDVVPQNLSRGESAYNVIKAIGDQEAKMFFKVDKSIIGDDLEHQSDEVIWHLLWENHLIKLNEGLALTKNKKERIELIASSVELHRYKGTPHAIEVALDVVGLKGKSEEWYRYNGEPYHFWVELKLKQKVNDLTLIRDMIMEYKNVRSWFDGFVILALDQGFLIWDDSYSYPVYYKECNDFWGNAKTINQEVCDVAQVDDSYSYPVYYDDINTTHIKYVNTGVTQIENDSYSYPVYYAECGELSTPDTKSMQFDDDMKINFEAYDYEVSYQECGDFEAGE